MYIFEKSYLFYGYGICYMKIFFLYHKNFFCNQKTLYIFEKLYLFYRYSICYNFISQKEIVKQREHFNCLYFFYRYNICYNFISQKEIAKQREIAEILILYYIYIYSLMLHFYNFQSENFVCSKKSYLFYRYGICYKKIFTECNIENCKTKKNI